MSYLMILKLKNIAVINNRNNPLRKNMSASFSSRTLLFSFLRIDIKDKMQLAINMMIASVAISSMMVASFRFNTLMEVSTIKHKPSRLDDVFKI